MQENICLRIYLIFTDIKSLQSMLTILEVKAIFDNAKNGLIKHLQAMWKIYSGLDKQVMQL